MLQNKRITLIVTGSIAAYKSCELVRLFKKKGADVTVVMTAAARKFVSALTFETLSGHPVQSDTFGTALSHITLAQQTDLVLVAPATANTIAKMAHGIADNLASSILLARTAPTAVAPAMNTQMWNNPATVRNMETIRRDGIRVIAPQSGELACGATGTGRMPEPADIVQACERLLSAQSLTGRRVVITAGPTFEAIDPVRGITNLSSGKQGYAIAKAAYEAGADVTLISGPVALTAPYGVRRLSVSSAAQMLEASQSAVQSADIFIAVAAVCDWRIAHPATQKLKKTAGIAPKLSFEENPDIVAQIAQSHPQLYTVAFAAETENVLENARLKLSKKHVRLVVANLATQALGQDTNTVTFISRTQEKSFPAADKLTVARQLMTTIASDLKD